MRNHGMIFVFKWLGGRCYQVVPAALGQPIEKYRRISKRGIHL